MRKFIEGVLRFQKDVFPQKKHLFERLAESQSPQVLFITCADSRIVPDLIMQTDPGDLFICRNAGNMVPSYFEAQGGVAATIEYAVSVLNVPHIVVCGHSNCGAMKGVLKPESVAELPAVKSWLHHGELARRIVKENYPNLPEEGKLEVLTQENVVAQLQHLRTHPYVAARVANGRLQLHGWVYHIDSGQVKAWDAERRTFVSIEEYGSLISHPVKAAG